MTAPIAARPMGTDPRARAPMPSDEARLRDAARQLESVFVNQLFQAMHATVDDDGLVPRGSGEDLFQSMLDQQLADQFPRRVAGDGALSTQLFEALRRRITPPTEVSDAATSASPRPSAS